MSRKNIQPIEDHKRRKASQRRFLSNVSYQDINELTQGRYSKSSELAMSSDWNHFVSFCRKKNVMALPASLTAIRLFLEHEARERKYSSIRRYSVTIGVIHKFHGFDDPNAHRQTKLVLKQLELQKLGDARQAVEMTQAHLLVLSEIFETDDSYQAARDIALYYLMFECALKRTELKTITLEAFTLTNGSLLVSLGEMNYQLSDNATKFVSRWINLLPHQEGYCFRRIDRHGNIGDDALDDSSIYRILRRASDKLGLSHDMRFTSQSARVGSARALHKQGHNLKDIQNFGRWLSPAMPAQYLNKTDIADVEQAKFKTIRPWLK